jgi:MFS family permease
VHESEYPRSTVAALSVLVFVSFGVQLYAMSVLLSENAAGGIFSISLLSAAFGGSVVIAGLLAPSVGRWADHHSVRGLMGVGGALAFGAMLIFSFSSHALVVLAAFWFLLGPAQAMTLYEPAFVAVGLWVGPDHRNRAIALLAVIGGLAGPVFIPVTGFAVDRFGWRPTAAGLGIAIVVTALVVTIGFYPSHTPAPRVVRPPKVRWRRFFVDRRLGLFTLSVVLLFASMNTMLFHRVAAFEEQGFSLASIAALAGLSSLLTFPGRYLAPRLAERFRASSVLTASAVGLALSMVLAVVGSPAVVMAAHFVFFGIFFGFTLPLRPVVMNEWYSGGEFGAVMGKQWSAAAVAGGLAPWLIGVVRDEVGSYAWPLLVLTIAVAAAAVFNELSVSRFALVEPSDTQI